jgi:hypothetical protein
VNKRMVMWLLIGWGLAVLLPPQQVVAMFRGKRG